MCQSQTEGRVRPPFPVLVSGLVWVMVDGGRTGPAADDVLGGPAIGAALGVRAAGAGPELLVAISDSMPAGSRRLVDALDPPGRLICRRPAPPLRWTAGPIVAETRRWTLEGDPRGWAAACEPDQVSGRALVLANGDPDPYARWLRSSQPGYVAIDVDGSWVASRPWAVNECLRRADLVTITRGDYDRVPPDVLEGTGVGRRPGAVLVIKSGSAGVEIVAGGQRRALPPPGVDARVGTDVGAGDVLLGFLAARLGSRAAPCDLEAAEAAYLDAGPTLSRLLQSRSFLGFADGLLEGQHAA